MKKWKITIGNEEMENNIKNAMNYQGYLGLYRDPIHHALQTARKIATPKKCPSPIGTQSHCNATGWEVVKIGPLLSTLHTWARITNYLVLGQGCVLSTGGRSFGSYPLTVQTWPGATS